MLQFSYIGKVIHKKTLYLLLTVKHTGRSKTNIWRNLNLHVYLFVLQKCTSCLNLCHLLVFRILKIWIPTHLKINHNKKISLLCSVYNIISTLNPHPELPQPPQPPSISPQKNKTKNPGFLTKMGYLYWCLSGKKNCFPSSCLVLN